ncbi:MAG: hypothetical protein EPN82_01830 [Bacteroidetes bacterium]|nr:MAG: hypothetical protein EPN82_01830 [Bacteroidota bacterium]
MENNLQNWELSYKKMQEMLPDYVFGRLTDEDKKLFEYNIPKYADLQDEIKQVKAVFGRVDSMELDKKITQKTRNLSIKVLNKLEQKSIRQRRFTFATRYLVPSIGLVIVLIIIFIINPGLKDSKSIEDKNKSMSEYHILNKMDALSLFDSTAQKADILTITTNLASENRKELSTGVDENTANRLWDDFIAQHLSSSLTGSETSLISMPENQSYNLVNELNNMEENDFQNVLKELSNVNFNI